MDMIRRVGPSGIGELSMGPGLRRDDVGLRSGAYTGLRI
jgi:hypothetical protein